MKQTELSFWRWLAVGSGAKPGFRRLVNRWLILHGAIGLAFAYWIPVGLETAANTVLLPLVGILIGLCFAWAGNAQALLQVSEIEEMTEHHKGGFAEYVFTYQAAIFAIFVTLVLWAIAGFKFFDEVWPTPKCAMAYFGVKFFLYAVSSLTLRECWHVVLGAQWMLMTQNEIKRAKRAKAANREQDSGRR